MTKGDTFKSVFFGYMFIVVLFIAAIVYLNYLDLTQKYNSVANRYADLWCQSQTYEEILVEEQRNYTDEFYTKTLSSKQNDYGLDVEIGYFFKNNTRIQKEDVNDIIPEGLVCEVIGSGKCFFEIPAITKLQNFETGKYYTQNNEIECIRQSRKL